MEENYTSHTFLLQVDTSNTSYLNEAAKWAKFLSIIGFIICVMLIITGLFSNTLLTASINEVDASLNTSGSKILLTVWFIIIAVLYFFPSFYLYTFASKMQIALRNNDQESLNASFRNLKSCLKFWGIFLIIILCFYALVMVFALIGSAFLH
jgi:hypothetical protein